MKGDNIMIKAFKREEKRNGIYIPEGVEVSNTNMIKGIVVGFSEGAGDDIFKDCDTNKEIVVYFSKFSGGEPFEYDNKNYTIIQANSIVCIEN